jgi:hypothetical protein
MATFHGGGVRLDDDGVVRFGHCRFWAERGLIRIEDDRDGSYETVSVRTALERARAISDMLGNSTSRQMYSEDQFDRANRERHLRFLEKFAAICQKAKVQGMPSDASARRDLRRRLPKSFVVPGLNSGM